jgi:hypothetical protein
MGAAPRCAPSFHCGCLTDAGLGPGDDVAMVRGLALSGGTPAFGAGTVPPLRLVNTRRRDGSDNLLLQYAVVNHDV